MSEKRIILILCAVTAAALLFMTGFWLGNREKGEFTPLEPPSVPAQSSSSEIPAPLQEEDIFPIDLNSASSEELQQLPGIGEVTAENILAYRKEHGFTLKEELKQVDGIGEKKYAELESLVTVK